MKGEREEAVKRALNTLLDSAQKVINASKDANIEIAIIGFNTNPVLITSSIKLISDEKNETIQKVKKQIESINSVGDTDIFGGLERAIQELENMVRLNHSGSHKMIFLSDGEDNLDENKIFTLHARLATVKGEIFVVGIGRGHNKNTLKTIAEGADGSFKGTYIDTTLGQDTIESAISKFYTQAIASFHQLELTAPQLKPEIWSVIDTPTVIENEQAKCILGSISEEEKLIKIVEIHASKLEAPLDLSTVSFKLTFIDPKGRRGHLILPWNPHITIIPEIVLAARTVQS